MINTIVQTYLWAFQEGETQSRALSDIDKKNLDDLILICVELLMGLRIWESSVLNPLNFMALFLLEYGLKKRPTNNSLRIW